MKKKMGEVKIMNNDEKIKKIKEDRLKLLKDVKESIIEK